MSKRQARDQLTKEPWERDAGSESEDDTSSKGPVTASQAVLAKRKIIKPRSRAVAGGTNAFGGITANGSTPKSNGFNFGQTVKPSIPTTNAFGAFATTKTGPTPTASPVASISTKGPPLSDINEKIKALNENFVHSVVKANAPNTIVNFVSIAEKYIEYYKKIQANQIEGNQTIASQTNSTTATKSVPAPVPTVNAAAAAAAADADSSSSSDSDEDIKIEGPQFTLTSKPTVKNSPFSFGPKPEKKKVDSDSDSESEIEIKGPTFQFNKTIKDSVFKVKGPETTKTDEPAQKPAFSFGAVEKKTEEKPALGGPASTFNFGTPSAASSDAPKPSFNFGAPVSDSSKPADAAKPFSFTSNASSAAKPFSFGTSTKPADEAKPSFSFGTASKPADEAKPSFSFGTASKPAEGAKPSFSFGSKPADSSADKPTTTESKPSSAFGSSSEKPVDSKPAFSFGAPATEAKPAFSFGTAATESKPAAPKTAFSFGAPAADSKTAFSFGTTATDSKPAESKPAFSFGTASVPASTENKPAFSFGSTTPASSEAKPAFTFGSATASGTQAKPAGAFNFSFNATPAASTNDSKAAVETPAAGDNEAADEEEPKVNFVPVAQLSAEKIENSQTGEEDDEVLYSKRTKLMLFDPSNKEQPYVNKGLGDVKVLKNKSTQKARILVRADGGLRVLLNALINKDVQYDTIGNGSMVRVPTVKEDKSIETFILKVKTPADGADLLKSLNDAK